MKKILTHLTGIVFLITILAAAGCGSGEKPSGSTVEEIDPVVAAIEQIKALDDSKKVNIYLKDVLINDTMHLFMYDDKKPIECGVIDDHLVVVKGGTTVKWENTQGSNIVEIVLIRTVGGDGSFFGAYPEPDPESRDSSEVFKKGNYKLELPLNATPGELLKYQIEFKVKDHEDTTYVIDPYLKVPDQ